jgi:hypothetical protein
MERPARLQLPLPWALVVHAPPVPKARTNAHLAIAIFGFNKRVGVKQVIHALICPANS